MRFCIFLLLIFSFSAVFCKNHVKSLTESMGQEVIEIGAPIKAELPPGLEEEPSAEVDDEGTTNTIQIATKRDVKKTTTKAPQPKTEIDKTLNSEEEEMKVEKELSDIYKDTDYKAEPSKEELSSSTVIEDKPIARSKNNFKFQPDLNDKADVERFRTSIDDISCEKRVTQRLEGEKPLNSACQLLKSLTIIGSALFSTLLMQ